MSAHYIIINFTNKRSCRIIGRNGSLRGISTVEALMSFSVICIALLGTVKTIGSSIGITCALTEREVAVRAAHAKIAEIDSQSFSQILVMYDSDAANDPGGKATAPGPYFAVSGLQPQAGYAAGNVGEIQFPVSGTQLREDINNTALGMPRDLNGDGKIDGFDHSADYKILPLLIRIRWKGPDGNYIIDVPTVLSGH
ncbi:MAG: hypothetical protein HY286_08390 [Planctomycetes bacterium]|nr:hypothetical protein [Planctomycetota bacterium]